MRTVLLAFTAMVLATTAAEAASIAAHRAIYDLKMVRATDRASFSGVDGRLAFEVQGSACEGWIVNFRMVSEYRPVEGNTRTVDTQSTAFESGDGLDMRYDQKEFIDGRLDNQSKIKVSRPSTGDEASGTLSSSGEKPFTVPSGSFFPMQHQLKLMDKAEQGETRDTSLVYDGSDGAATYRAITFIGRRKDAGTNTRDNGNGEAKPLAGLPSWPVSISYYHTSGDDQDVPSYQVSFDLYENGVATGLVLDYGVFVLSGEMTKFELLKSEPCS